MSEFNEDAYRDNQLNKYLDEQEETQEDIDAYEDAMCDRADAQRELEREQQNEC